MPRDVGVGKSHAKRENNLISEQIQEWLAADDGGQRIRSVEGIFTFATDIGIKRTENQDRVAVLRVSSAARTSGFWCACLCDGMGGMKEGGQAATLSVSQFFQSLIHDRKFNPEERLHRATIEASNYVRSKVPGGGATLSAILLENNRVYSVNVGDSRIYALDGSDPESIKRLTVDDTMKEAYGSEGRGLLQHIGMSGKILPHIQQIHSNSGENIIVTSDGAHRIGDDYLRSIWINAANKEEYCERVLSIARWIGGVDNASVISLSPNSNAFETSVFASSDVSIWTTSGRMKISWSATSQSGGHEQTKKSEASDKNVQAKREAQFQAGAGHQDEEQPKEKQKKAPRKNSSSRSKQDNLIKNPGDQVELGFSDEGSGE